MSKATIEDVVNIAVGCGLVADTPAARERYKTIVRRQSAARVAASGKAAHRSTAPLPKQKAAAAPRAASAPAQPTEYPSSWGRGRRLGVAAGLRIGRKAGAR
jgi:hypothetical protein